MSDDLPFFIRTFSPWPGATKSAAGTKTIPREIAKDTSHGQPSFGPIHLHGEADDDATGLEGRPKDDRSQCFRGVPRVSRTCRVSPANCQRWRAPLNERIKEGR